MYPAYAASHLELEQEELRPCCAGSAVMRISVGLYRHLYVYLRLIHALDFTPTHERQTAHSSSAQHVRPTYRSCDAQPGPLVRHLRALCGYRPVVVPVRGRCHTRGSFFSSRTRRSDSTGHAGGKRLCLPCILRASSFRPVEGPGYPRTGPCTERGHNVRYSGKSPETSVSCPSFTFHV